MPDSLFFALRLQWLSTSSPTPYFSIITRSKTATRTLQKPSLLSSTVPRSLRSFRVARGAAAGACCVDVVVAGEWSSH